MCFRRLLIGIGARQLPATRATNLPVLQSTLSMLERDMGSASRIDTAATPDRYKADGMAVEVIAGLVCRALEDRAHRHFPPGYSQHVGNWAATRSLPNQQTVFGRLTSQLSQNAALLQCGNQLN